MSRVLFATTIPPWPPYGGQYIRTYNQIDSLSHLRRHFTVGVLAPPVADDCPLRQEIDHWYAMPDEKMRVSHLGLFRRQRSWARAVEQAIHKFQPDLVWFDAAYWGTFIPLARRQGAAVIQGRFNVQPALTRQRVQATPSRWRRWLGWARYGAERLHERRFIPQSDGVVVVSPEDRACYQRLGRGVKVYVLPNYVNETWYEATTDGPRAEATVVMTGNYLSFQNWHGARWFLTAIWPLLLAQVPQACLQLVGKGAERLAEVGAAQVEFVGQVPSVTPTLRQGTVAAVPLLHGSGTRYKILEAFAAEIPVVSTSLGAQGIAAAPGEEILLADDPAGFATTLAHLLRSPERRRHLAQRARRLLSAEYGFAANTARLGEIIEHVIASQEPPA